MADWKSSRCGPICFSCWRTQFSSLLVSSEALHSKFCKGRIKWGFQSSWLYCNVHFGLSADEYDSVRYLLRPLGLEIEYVNMKSKSDHIYLTFNQPSERQKLYHKIIVARQAQPTKPQQTFFTTTTSTMGNSLNSIWIIPMKNLVLILEKCLQFVLKLRFSEKSPGWKYVHEKK